MIYGFDTDDRHVATAALMLYAVWRSRDKKRFKVTPEVWGQIERFTKAAAKRSINVARWLDGFKPRVCCDTISPQWMATGLRGRIEVVPIRDGANGIAGYAQFPTPEGQREFMAEAIKRVDERHVVDLLYRETAWIVLLVRDRLEREKPVEQQFNPIDPTTEESL